MTENEIRSRLFEMSNSEYRDFQCRLMPTVSKENVIGVRTPLLKGFAKELVKQNEAEEFLSALPHKYFDENQLHAFIISEIREYNSCVKAVEEFLPYVDNWATCDQLRPKVFAKHTKELEVCIMKWIKSEKTYTVRFAIGMLMSHYLGERFDIKYPESVAAVRSEEYYIKMMIAWYFATALAKQYSAVLPFIEEKRLDIWTHNKAIQKAVESRRITDEQKAHLKSLTLKSI